MTIHTTSTTVVRDTVLTALSDVLAEPVEALHAEPLLGMHAWDSLASLEALVRIEADLGVSLDLRQYHAAREIGDLVDLVSAAMAHH